MESLGTGVIAVNPPPGTPPAQRLQRLGFVRLIIGSGFWRFVHAQVRRSALHTFEITFAAMRAWRDRRTLARAQKRPYCSYQLGFLAFTTPGPSVDGASSEPESQCKREQICHFSPLSFLLDQYIMRLEDSPNMQKPQQERPKLACPLECLSSPDSPTAIPD